METSGGVGITIAPMHAKVATVIGSQVVTSWASAPGVRRSMQANRGKDTSLELAVRSALHRSGLRFRKNTRPVPHLRCEADVLFPAIRLAVFMDGCFWHGCPTHATRPATHQEWWARKLDRNVARDRENDLLLEDAGWTVLRLWEHEQIADSVRKVADLVLELRARRSTAQTE
jgi:DNA mismatch endonuclease (patch repair protein)